MIAINTTHYHGSMIRKSNVWISIKDGDWRDRSIWMGNGIKKTDYPRSGDIVHINHAVRIADFETADRVFIAGTLKGFSSYSLTVNDTLQVMPSGAIDFTGSSVNLILNGYNNRLINFTAGSSTVTYNYRGDQTIAPVVYNGLQLNTESVYGIIGTKRLIANLTVNGNLDLGGSTNFDIGTYNVSVNGNTLVGGQFGPVESNPTIIASPTYSGNILFNGRATFNTQRRVVFLGSPNIEFRNGVQMSGFGQWADFGTGVVTFSTRNQSVDFSAGVPSQINYSIVIAGAITVTLTGGIIYSNNSINGTVSTSTLAVNGSLYLMNPTYYAPMATGVFNYKAGTSAAIGYVGNGNFNLPYNDYVHLNIAGTGTKYITSDTSLTGTLNVESGGTLEVGVYNLTVTGNTGINYPLGALSKNSNVGKIVFIGAVNFNTESIYFANCDVEFRNGGSLSSGAGVSTHFGTGTFKFTTNNQSIAVQVPNTITSFNILIDAGITLTVNANLNTSGTINGVNSASKLINRAVLRIYNPNAPMVTGVLDASTGSNQVNYYNAGNQDIQGGTYLNLSLGGAGVKKLLGNVSVLNAYTLTAPATLNSNGFALTNP